MDMVGHDDRGIDRGCRKPFSEAIEFGSHNPSGVVQGDGTLCDGTQHANTTLRADGHEVGTWQ